VALVQEGLGERTEQAADAEARQCQGDVVPHGR
jgi:hypothetical protein